MSSVLTCSDLCHKKSGGDFNTKTWLSRSVIFNPSEEREDSMRHKKKAFACVISIQFLCIRFRSVDLSLR